ncbi:CDP-diacylglycerol--serine O-phosphatidyltransferase [Hymenobacter taeanensis]|uniref:CDP-diacylglycerol--serine O-phosphatidyltransferase n=1 Tax=Hymenobacter taeanensis TaxID=2735321 RepID=A0A6M6BHG9_9BACT|nr:MULTISPECIES: CDP-diacylglycerol--serine O-phosphatidyltransferase [Hymenobacter]QJX47234.1 CDP-diacylglycerol--serine O-phosphatidyltransferase [Hymenobacter taeanensis]UOQ79429.1 CDP-diacylglycerol--serine O-phosphatidyltransferase [Hymenobacter sp. 5414T-23]
MKKHLPNAVTCLNLFSGCLALTQIFSTDGNLVYASYFVLLAAVFDFFDGLLARALHVSSPIGKDLDSLADVVSFGVVPGAIIYKLLQGSLTTANLPTYLAYVGFIVTIFSALRLARFNNDTRQSDSFIGLPTPACTLVVASLPLILEHDSFNLATTILNPWLLLALAVILSGLLVAELPLFALKFKSLRWQDNSVRFIFLLLSVGLLLGLGVVAVPLIILLYVLLSLVRPAKA